MSYYYYYYYYYYCCCCFGPGIGLECRWGVGDLVERLGRSVAVVAAWEAYIAAQARDVAVVVEWETCIAVFLVLLKQT